MSLYAIFRAQERRGSIDVMTVRKLPPIGQKYSFNIVKLQRWLYEMYDDLCPLSGFMDRNVFSLVFSATKIHIYTTLRDKLGSSMAFHLETQLTSLSICGDFLFLLRQVDTGPCLHTSLTEFCCPFFCHARCFIMWVAKISAVRCR